MKARRTVAAVDLGAESGRVATIAFDGERLDLDVAHRFSHVPAQREGLLRWDLRRIWREVHHGLGLLAAGDRPISSVGVDSWGVDYGLLDDDGARHKFLREVAALTGKPAPDGSVSFAAQREARLDRLADMIDEYADTGALLRLIEAGAPAVPFVPPGAP